MQITFDEHDLKRGYGVLWQIYTDDDCYEGRNYTGQVFLDWQQAVDYCTYLHNNGNPGWMQEEVRVYCSAQSAIDEYNKNYPFPTPEQVAQWQEYYAERYKGTGL